MDLVEPLQGVGQVAAVVAIVVAAGGEVQEGHVRIAAALGQHLLIGWPGLLILSASTPVPMITWSNPSASPCCSPVFARILAGGLSLQPQRPSSS
jgi:hypothetical protein